MAKMKTVSVEARLGEKFRVEVKAGNHTLFSKACFGVHTCYYLTEADYS